MKSWAGRRVGAGRKRRAGKRRVEHRRRVGFGTWSPLHVNVRLVAGLPSLRTPAMDAVLRRAFEAGCERDGFRVVQYSAMPSRVDQGGFPPWPPTDPDVQLSRIRLFAIRPALCGGRPNRRLVVVGADDA